MTLTDYTTIDFETANSNRGSACSVGLVRVRNGAPVDEQEWLIHPPEGIDHFDGFNVGLHHITAEMVRDEPSWKERLDDLVDYVGEDVLVAHYASFDVSVIARACWADKLPVPEFKALCTCNLAHQVLDLPSYSLSFVAEACGVDLHDHHNALADARAVAGIMQHLQTYPELDLFPAKTGGCRAPHKYIALEADLDADPTGHLYGKRVAVTGTLMAMRKQDAFDLVAQAGGKPQPSGVTEQTNILVLGTQEAYRLAPGATLSNKAKKAMKLRDKGQDIELMSERDFIRALT